MARLPKIKRTFQLICLGLLIWPLCVHADNNDLLNLDLTDLMQIQVTSAGRKEQNLFDVPAAIYVIDSEDIKISAATSLPELLRMVPGLQVARIGSSKWAISSRGFNGTFSSELLVQIDGRTVYTPAFSGVYWDMQTVMLEEIERIEIIRGPGATLWGANAVNGIINIITKPASEAVGLHAEVLTGNHEKAGGSLRYGNQMSTNSYAKLYFEYHQRDAFNYSSAAVAEPSIADQSDSGDEWEMLNGGFRLDGDVGLTDNWTLQGDIYSGHEDQQVYANWPLDPLLRTLADDTIDVSGHNILGRWQHDISEKSSVTVQAYYDYSKRDESYIGQSFQTFDLDLQHRFFLWNRHDIVWGGGYRHIIDDFDSTYLMSMDPESVSSDLYSAFVQDEIALVAEKLYLTLGSKYEHNDYTGNELQPSARLMWRLSDNQNLWTAVSRAVRTPSRFERDISVVMYHVAPNTPAYMSGTSGYDSEEVVAYEAGYRMRTNKILTLDLTLFYNEYSELREYGFSLAGANVINDGEGTSKGIEVSIEWTPTDWLTTVLNYSYIDMDITSGAVSPSPVYSTNATVLNSSSPSHQVSLRADLDLRKDLRLSLFGRYVDELKLTSPSSTETIDAYFALDASILWQINHSLSLKIAGQNLTDPAHLEFINEYFTQPTEVGRSVYAQLNFKY